MTEIDRRKFIQRLGALFGSAGVAACGGGGGSAANGAQANAPLEPTATPSNPGPSPAPGEAPPPPPQSIPAPSGALQFALVSPAGGTNAPFCIGFPFRKGDIPAGRSVVASLAGVQATVKNRWPDGSPKFAIVAGRATLQPNQPLTISLAAGDAASSTVLTTADLAATGITAQLGCGTFGTATWQGSQWSTPFLEWVSGPEMSSWIYRAPVGGDPHLVAWLEVRLWRGGVVEVLPWVENGYLKVAGPTSKAATYTFSLGGTQRYSGALDVPHHCRTVLVAGTDVSHWSGTAPNVSVKHNADYLQATRLVPAYQSSVSPGAAAVLKQPTSFAPFQAPAMEHPEAMGSGGYASQIGLLPEWDALYLTSSADLWKAVQWNHYGLGRYAIHYRDETTGRPLRFSSYANTRIDYRVSDALQGMTHLGSSSTGTYLPAPSGTTPPGMWVDTHHPAPGYFAYLITGRFYFLEECQFGATAHFLRTNSTYSQGAGGVFDSLADQVRGFAFSFRTLAQAAAITPDGDALQIEFRNSVASNVAFYRGKYVDPGKNKFGFINHADVGGNYGDQTPGDGIHFQQAWMQDYSIACVGYAHDLVRDQLDATSQDNFDRFFDWHAQAVVGRLGTSSSTEFLYRNAAPYEIAMAPVDNADLANGTAWYADWGAVYKATFGGSGSSVSSSPPYAPDCPRADGGNLVGGYFGDASTGGGYWGYMQPALSYAVRHGRAGAWQAWGRLQNAPNWYAQQAVFDAAPLWAVAPYALPAWRYGQAVGEWREIPGSSMSNTPPSYNPGPTPSDRVDAWNGLSLDTRTNTLWSLANGGHNNYYGNEVLRLTLADDAPKWVEVLPATDVSQISDVSPAPVRYKDGRPASNHSYYEQQFIERHNRAVRVGAQASSMSGSSYYDMDGWNAAAASGVNAWDAQYTYPPINPVNPGVPASTIGWAVCKDPDTECIYVFAHNSAMRKFTPNAGGTPGGTWATVGSAPTSPNCVGDLAAMAIDSRRKRILIAKGSPNYPYGANSHYFVFDTTANTFSEVALSGAALSALNAAVTGIGMVYVPEIDAYLIRLHGAGGGVIKVDAATWTTTFLATTGGDAIPATANVDGQNAYQQYENVFTKWLFVPSLRGIVFYPRYTSNLWFLRVY